MAKAEQVQKADASTLRRILKAQKELEESRQADPQAAARRIRRSLYGVPAPTSPGDTTISDQVIDRQVKAARQGRSRSHR
jgi:hypothetical protein